MDNTTFIEYLKKIAVPFGVLLYILALFAQFYNYFNVLGLRIIFSAVFCLAIAWCTYIWSAKVLSSVEPKQLIKKFSKKRKYLSIAVVILSTIPLLYSFYPEESFPLMPIHIVNNTNDTVSVNSYGEYSLSIPVSPFNDQQVDYGRICIVDRDVKMDQLILVLPGNTKKLFVEFINSKKLVPTLKRGDHSIMLMFYQDDGQMLTQRGVHFTRENIENNYCLLEIKSKNK